MSGQDTIIKTIEIPEASIRLRADGIVHVQYHKHVVLDLMLQKKMRELFWEITDGKKAKFIFAAEEGFVFSKEARENIKLPGKESPILYYALVCSNLAYKIIANFYIKVMKPHGHYKVVSSVQEAVEWLNSVD
jgi:hypothetical protein